VTFPWREEGSVSRKSARPKPIQSYSPAGDDRKPAVVAAPAASRRPSISRRPLALPSQTARLQFVRVKLTERSRCSDRRKGSSRAAEGQLKDLPGQIDAQIPRGRNCINVCIQSTYAGIMFYQGQDKRDSGIIQQAPNRPKCTGIDGVAIPVQHARVKMATLHPGTSQSSSRASDGRPP